MSPVAGPYAGLAWGKRLVDYAVGCVDLRIQHVLPWTIRPSHLSSIALRHQTTCIKHHHKGRVEAKRSFYLNIVERIGHVFQTPSRFDFASGVQQFGPAHLAGCDDPARLLLACEGDDGSSSNMSREAWTMILSCVPPAMMGGACDASKYGTTLSWVQTSHGRGKIVKDCQRSRNSVRRNSNPNRHRLRRIEQIRWKL